MNRQRPIGRVLFASGYAVAALAIGLAERQRDLPLGRLLLWAALCDVTGFVLVAALLGWAILRLGSLSPDHLRPGIDEPWPGKWFLCLQALLAAATTLVAVWIALDFSFDGMGAGWALFGLAGRRAGCPALLMLLGATILMAWQTRGTWRAGWQFAALVTGMLFTCSLGWSGVDAATDAARWFQRSLNLLISAAMMTLMTGLGLGRILPRDSDWLTRARRALPLFGALALLMLLVVLIFRAFGHS